MLQHPVLDIAWTEDSQRIIAVGNGQGVYSKGLNADTGSKVGDQLPATKALYSVDIKKKPFKVVAGGENYHIFEQTGVPFKNGKTITDQHTHFINRVRFNDQGNLFATASSDKSVVIFDSETVEPTKKIETAHSKGILDLNWLDDENFMTASSDNTVKIWNVSGEVHKTLQVSQDDEKVELQQLAIGITKKHFYSVSLSSDINVFSGKEVFEEDKLLPCA